MEDYLQTTTDVLLFCGVHFTDKWQVLEIPSEIGIRTGVVLPLPVSILMNLNWYAET